MIRAPRRDILRSSRVIPCQPRVHDHTSVSIGWMVFLDAANSPAANPIITRGTRSYCSNVRNSHVVVATFTNAVPIAPRGNRANSHTLSQMARTKVMATVTNTANL